MKADHIDNVMPKQGAHFIGNFMNGQAVGHFWIGLG